jgi:hypothetical protein
MAQGSVLFSSIYFKLMNKFHSLARSQLKVAKKLALGNAISVHAAT